MDTGGTRRQFLSRCGRLGACCALLGCNGRLFAEGHVEPGGTKGQGKTPIDLKQLSYCGIPCGEQVCELYRMTYDPKMKQDMYAKHPKEMNALFGITTFDPDRIVCNTCKPGDKPLGISQDRCPTRRCALANGVESCIQCGNLPACGQRTWKSMPHHYAYAKWTQARYVSQPGSVLVDGRQRQ